MRFLSKFSLLKPLTPMLIGFSLLLPTSLSWAQSEDDDPVKIGVLMPISGPGAFYGNPAVVGVKLAVDEANRNNGLFGKPVEYFVRDTQLNPSVAAAAARELILNEGVDALIGGVSSGVALAISEVAKQEKIVYIAPVAKTTDLTQKNGHRYTFVTSANTDIEGEQLASVAKQLGARNVCITGYDYAYSYSLFDRFKQTLDPKIRISSTFYVNLGNTDYTALIGQLLISECDTIVGAIWGGGYIAFIKQSAPFGLLKTKKIIWGAEVGGQEMAGSLRRLYPAGQWANAYDAWYYNNGSIEHRRYQARLADEQGRKSTDMFPITSYVATQFVLEAIRQTDGTDSNALVDALEAMELETPMGIRRFNERHEMNTGQLWGQMGFIESEQVARILEPHYHVVDH